MHKQTALVLFCKICLIHKCLFSKELIIRPTQPHIMNSFLDFGEVFLTIIIVTAVNHYQLSSPSLSLLSHHLHLHPYCYYYQYCYYFCLIITISICYYCYWNYNYNNWVIVYIFFPIFRKRRKRAKNYQVGLLVYSLVTKLD